MRSPPCQRTRRSGGTKQKDSGCLTRLGYGSLHVALFLCTFMAAFGRYNDGLSSLRAATLTPGTLLASLRLRSITLRLVAQTPPPLLATMLAAARRSLYLFHCLHDLALYSI